MDAEQSREERASTEYPPFTQEAAGVAVAVAVDDTLMESGVDFEWVNSTQCRCTQVPNLPELQTKAAAMRLGQAVSARQTCPLKSWTALRQARRSLLTLLPSAIACAHSGTPD